VFNFFRPGYAPNGELKDLGLVAPEFQITTASTIVGISNLMDAMTFGEEVTFFESPAPFSQQVYLDLNTEIALAANAGALVNHLDVVLTYGTLTTTTRDAVVTAVSELQDPLERVYRAIYLISISPDFAIAL
jgi:hypothetical protein